MTFLKFCNVFNTAMCSTLKINRGGEEGEDWTSDSGLRIGTFA